MSNEGLRVLVLTQGFPRHPGDHRAPFVLDHARALAGAGLQVMVVCPSAPGLSATDEFGGVSVRRFRYAPRRAEVLAYSGAMHRSVLGPAGLLLPAFLVGYLVAALRHGRDADVLHGHWWAPSGLIAVIAGRLLGVPTVVHLHGTDAAIARGPLRWLARRVLRAADAVVASSADLAGWAHDVAGVDAVIAPMPLGVDRLPAPSPPPLEGPVLAVGRLVPEKGFDVLVRAAALARTPVVLVGEGTERATLEALVADLHAPVTFTGALAPDALAEQYRAARLIAVPSRREGFGLVAAEAAAAGRAVIASAVGGLPDVVRSGETGVLIPPDDVDALAAALGDTDPALGANGPAAVTWLAPAAIAARNLGAYDAARAGVRPALGPRLVRVVGGVLAVIAVAVAVATLARRWDTARRLDIAWSPRPIAAAVASVAVANLAMAWAWGWLGRRVGGGLRWREAMRVFWAGQLGRYLPTGLGSLPARVVLGARAGAGRRLLLATTSAEVVVSTVVTAAAAGLLLPGLVGPLVATLGTAVAIPIAAFTLSRVGRAQGGVVRAATEFTAMHALIFGVRALGFWAVLHVTAGASVPSFADAAGALGLSVFLGTVAVFSPGGIGVREAVLAATLSHTAGAAGATTAAVAWRLLEVAVELPILAWSRTLYRPRA